MKLEGNQLLEGKKDALRISLRQQLGGISLAMASKPVSTSLPPSLKTSTV